MAVVATSGCCSRASARSWDPQAQAHLPSWPCTPTPPCPLALPAPLPPRFKSQRKPTSRALCRVPRNAARGRQSTAEPSASPVPGKHSPCSLKGSPQLLCVSAGFMNRVENSGKAGSQEGSKDRAGPDRAHVTHTHTHTHTRACTVAPACLPEAACHAPREPPPPPVRPAASPTGPAPTWPRSRQRTPGRRPTRRPTRPHGHAPAASGAPRARAPPGPGGAAVSLTRASGRGGHSACRLSEQRAFTWAG